MKEINIGEMKDKYIKRAKELCSTLFEEPCTWEEDSIESDFLNLMVQLAEEVESKTVSTLLDSSRISYYSKEQVEELLQKQRELCAEEADTETAYKPCYEHGLTTVNKESILNAKLKID